MRISYKQMRTELIEYLKAYRSIDIILKLDNAELETLYKQVTIPKPKSVSSVLTEEKQDGIL
jgi:hypothetical protein